MRKMGEGGLNIMDDFGSFGGFQGTDSGRTLGVFCQHIPLEVSEDKWKEEEEVFNFIEG